jgi:L-asparagine transporter-like permease
MEIRYSPAKFTAGLLAAMVGFWFVFWEPGPLGESPLYAIGPLLLAAGSVVAAIQFSARPRTGAEGLAAPAEIDAWLALVYTGVLIAWLLSNASAFTVSWMGARTASIALLQIVVVYVVISAVLRGRRGKAVQEDERDRAIRRSAAKWGRHALIACVVVLMVTLGMSQAHRLAWATPPAVAFLLFLGLLLGWLLENAATIVYYWRDRR